VAKKKPNVDDPSLSFEQSLADLEQIVARLEGGKLGLSESLTAYEQGVQRLKGCYEMLRQAEQRIELVQSVDAGGRAQTIPLDDPEADDLEEKSAARSRRRSARGAGPTNGPAGDGDSLF